MPSARPSAHSRGYNWRWRKASKGYLAKHPLCVPCEKAGTATLAELVHHKVPHRGDAKLFWDKANWEGRCTTCHADAQRVEQSVSSSTESYRGCDENGMPLDPGHRWVQGHGPPCMTMHPNA